MEIRIFFFRFTISPKYMTNPLRFGLGLGAASMAVGLVIWLLIPWLCGEVLTWDDLLITGIFGLLGFLFGWISTAVHNRRIRKLREQYTDSSTLLCATTTRIYTELIQVNKHNLTGELFLSPKRLQYFPHSDVQPDPTFNSSLEDIQTATVVEIHGKPVLQVERYEEKVYFEVKHPEEWAYKIRQAMAELQMQNGD